MSRRVARLFPEARVTSPAEAHRRLATGTVVLNAIIREFLAEAAAIGLLGGLAGLSSGFGLIVILNRYFAGRGVEIFFLTPRLVAFALLFSVGLGAAAGLYPRCGRQGWSRWRRYRGNRPDP